MGSYAGGHNAADHKQIDKRTTMRNQNRNAALGRPAMKLLGWGPGKVQDKFTRVILEKDYFKSIFKYRRNLYFYLDQ